MHKDTSPIGNIFVLGLCRNREQCSKGKNASPEFRNKQPNLNDIMPPKRTNNSSFEQQNSFLTGIRQKVGQQREYEKET